MLVSLLSAASTSWKCCVVCRAAEAGNIEALIKLGIAYLYNEGCKYILLHVV